jgi:predicted dienelactone hydrolase
LVAALTHPGDNHRDKSLLGKLEFFTERPRQVSRLLEALLADPTWRPRIDAARIGFFGHSSGGFTGLALLGAAPSLKRTVSHCADNFDADPWFCQFSGSKERALAAAQQLPYLPDVPGSPDSRFRAAVLVTPVGAFFSTEALGSIKVPSLVVVAGRDDVLVPRFHAEFVASAVPRAQVLSVAAGGHFMWVSSLAIQAVLNGADVNGDPPGFDRAAAIRAAQTSLPAWFDKELAR